MIRCNQLLAAGIETPLEMDIVTGWSAAVITPREHENGVIVRLILGIQQSLGGELFVDDVQPAALRDAQLSAFRRKIGIVYSEGGLLSNLNVWDNLTLQLSYDGEYRSSEIEERGREALQRAGYDGLLGVLPSRLSLFQRRQIAMARIFLAEPPLVIYQSILDGLSRPEQKHLRRLAQEYQHETVARTSLFLTSYPDSLKGIEFDLIYNRGGTSQP